MTKVKAAAIYARISQDPGGQGLGVRRQLDDCRRLAAERGWMVAEEYTDNDVSAYSGRVREGYERMLADLRDGLRDAVIVYNLDRLTRRPIELEQFAQICEAAKVQQVATVTTDIDLATDDGLLMARMLAAFAAKESARKSARVKRKMLQNAEMGRPHNGSTRAFGYERDGLTVIESEAAVIRTLAQRFVAGESLRSLAVWLDAERVPTVTGGEWRTTTLRPILCSGRIAGLREHNGQVIGPAAWPPIITVRQRDQILARIEAQRVSGRRAPRRYLLTGLLRCGKCQGRLFSSARVNTRRYVCLSGPDHQGCGGITVTAAPLERFLADAVLTALDTPWVIDALNGRSATDEIQAQISAELEADLAQLDELAAMYAARELPARQWKAARVPIEARVANARRQIAAASGRHALTGLAGHGRQLRAQWETLNLDRQHAIVAAVLDYVVIQPGIPGTRGFDTRRVEAHWRV